MNFLVLVSVHHSFSTERRNKQTCFCKAVLAGGEMVGPQGVCIAGSVEN